MAHVFDTSIMWYLHVFYKNTISSFSGPANAGYARQTYCKLLLITLKVKFAIYSDFFKPLCLLGKLARNLDIFIWEWHVNCRSLNILFH